MGHPRHRKRTTKRSKKHTTHTLPRFGISPGYNFLTRNSADRTWEYGEHAALGSKVIRLDATTGSQTALDTIVPEAVSRGLEVILILYGTTGVIANDSFAGDQALKWRNLVTHFEICNEPDLHGWTANGYADFVASASDDVKAVNPGAKVIAGALWKGGGLGTANDPKAMATALCTRAAGKFDYLSMHLYDDANSRGSWNIWDWAFEWGGSGWCDNGANGGTVRKALNDNGHSNIPIIGTESGGPMSSYSEAEQADIVTNGMQAVKDGKLASLLVYNIVPDEVGVTDYGLTRGDRTRRPAWTSFQTQAA